MTTREFLRVEHPRLASVLRRRRAPLLVGFDLVAIAVAYGLFTLLRYESAVPPWRGVLVLGAVAAVAHFALGWGLKLYRGRAAVGSTDETLYLGVISFLAACVATAVNVVPDEQLAARTLPFGAAFMAYTAMVFTRAQWRRYAAATGTAVGHDAQPTVIVGAGEAGEQLIRSMRMSASSPFNPVALIDDDHWKRFRRLDGVPVRGRLADLERVVEATGASAVVVAIPSASRDLLRDVSDRGTAMGLDVKVLPPVAELFGTSISIRDVRDINVEDLLGRGTIETDIASIADFLNGKRVLVTGAGGSIGSELCRQIAKWHPGELMMLDRDESALHGVELSIQGHGLLDSDDTVLCNIRDADALNEVFDDRRPQVVFHAAALKHLPLLERFPGEAVKTNVLGTANVLEAAARVEVERFVNISTDKAADPTSVLGYSKRAAERLTADYGRSHPGTWMSVRFGNVLGSRGSVLTTFAAQIARGGPITVTHPDVTRYFMTVSEAVQLVLQAGAIGRDGEVLILDMGDPVRIDDVAKQLIAQSGRRIEVVYTGLREGEKLDEILRSDTERDHRPVHDLISHVTVAPLAAGDLGAEQGGTPTGDPVKLLREWCHVTDGYDVPSQRH